MRKKNEFWVYTCMWMAAVMILLVLLMQNLGDARIVNYSGIVRGATQKLVKEEMNGLQDDALIERLDGIIHNLQTGRGDYHLRRNNDEKYQEQLAHLEHVWRLVKEEIYKVRQGSASPESLFQLSQEHFAEADKMVLLAEQGSENKLRRFIVVYGIILFLSVGAFTMVNYQNRRALEESIYTDNLTGILNRPGFEASASALLRQRSGNRYCLLELDIDDFKFLNNSYGYELGDKLLRALAGGLKNEYRLAELCARISADDFVILAKQEEQSVERLRRLLSAVLTQEAFVNVSEFITFTVGGYVIPENSEAVQSVMDKAGMAHKNAKALGKCETIWYNNFLLEKLNRENILKNRLHHALDHGELKMYLQPKYTLSDLKIHSAEALVRWEIPERGIVAPDDFIPLFERNGRVADIDFYMLEKACSYIRQHLDTSGQELLIAVNFSRVTLYQQRFSSTILDIADRYRVPYHCIELEITESSFNDISDVMIHKILQLRDLGFIISMDDFGSGYSSLNLLDKLPIQVLKLDREFLREYDSTGRVQSVISCVTDLAHALGIRVVCEGIERAEHVAFLQDIGCDYGQGYYFSRPVAQDEFAGKL